MCHLVFFTSISLRPSARISWPMCDQEKPTDKLSQVRWDMPVTSYCMATITTCTKIIPTCRTHTVMDKKMLNDMNKSHCFVLSLSYRSHIEHTTKLSLPGLPDMTVRLPP